MNVRSSVLGIAVGLLVVGLIGGTAEGADFRVESKVFSGKDKEPMAESTTIFSGGVVYDYLKAPAEVTVFDPAHGRFLLLDIERKIQTELTTQEVERFSRRLTAWAANHTDPLLKFMAAPRFDETSDAISKEMAFASPWATYRVEGEAVDNVEIAEQYRQFSDGHARLNALINPGALPPAARLHVNASLEKQGLVPRTVSLTLNARRGFPPKKVSLHSQHHLVERLVESDRRRVAQVGQFLAMFRKVTFSEYQK